MDDLFELLKINNCEYDFFLQQTHNTLLLFVLEEICKQLKEDASLKESTMHDFYKTKDEKRITEKLVYRVCGTRLPEKDLKWINECVKANLKKRGKREIISYSLKEELLSSQNYKCACCGKDLSMDDAHYDHIVPWDFVGDELSNNVQMLCSYCNEHKSASSYYMLKRQIIKNNI